MELDIKEMLELGKKAAHTRKISNTNVIEAEDTSIGNRYVCACSCSLVIHHTAELK